MPEYIYLTTPENIEIRFEIAGLTTRMRAFFYDSLHQLFLAIVIFVIGINIAPVNSASYDLVRALVIFLQFVLFWGYHVFFEFFMNGQSPGKRHFGLRVITLDGQRIEFFPSLVRNLVRIVDFLPIGFLAGIVAILISQNGQRIGDFFARTIVIRERNELPVSSKQFSKNFPSSTPVRLSQKR